MKYQIIVSLNSLRLFPTEQQPIRPFSWVSATGENVADMIETLKKHALRDMNFTADEAETMSVRVLRAFNNGDKAVTSSFNKFEFITVTVMDEEEITIREQEVFQLMMGAVGPVDKSQLN